MGQGDQKKLARLRRLALGLSFDFLAENQQPLQRALAQEAGGQNALFFLGEPKPIDAGAGLPQQERVEGERG